MAGKAHTSRRFNCTMEQLVPKMAHKSVNNIITRPCEILLPGGLHLTALRDD